LVSCDRSYLYCLTAPARPARPHRALGLDTTIIAIRWRFTIERRGEETGGMAIFAAPESRSVKAHLLPTNSISWTRLPNSDRFETTEYSFGRWLVVEVGENIKTVPP
jgi:hypothetical protein